jgi:tellurite resistance protein
MTGSTSTAKALGTALKEAAFKIHTAVREIAPREDVAPTWVQRIIYREIEQRARTRGPAYWEEQFPGLPAATRAQQRIRRMITRATVAGVAAAASASTAEVLSLVSDGSAAPAALPLGLVSMGAELLYTTALQIDLAFDLASIYGVPYQHDDIGEISTLLAVALGVELMGEPTRHDKPAPDGETKPWRVVRQMQRDDFAHEVGVQLLQQSVLRNVVPIAGVLVSAIWNQIVLRRFARSVHAAARQRLAIVVACRNVKLGDSITARYILDGAWLLATADGAIGHHEALALSILIDSLPLPERIAVHEASFPDDEEEWFTRMARFDPNMQDVLLEVLALIAAADGKLNTAERRFLRRLGNALGRNIDFVHIKRIVARLRGSDDEEGPLVTAPATATN